MRGTWKNADSSWSVAGGASAPATVGTLSGPARVAVALADLTLAGFGTFHGVELERDDVVLALPLESPFADVNAGPWVVDDVWRRPPWYADGANATGAVVYVSDATPWGFAPATFRQVGSNASWSAGLIVGTDETLWAPDSMPLVDFVTTMFGAFRAWDRVVQMTGTITFTMMASSAEAPFGKIRVVGSTGSYQGRVEWDDPSAEFTCWAMFRFGSAVNNPAAGQIAIVETANSPVSDALYVEVGHDGTVFKIAIYKLTGGAYAGDLCARIPAPIYGIAGLMVDITGTTVTVFTSTDGMDWSSHVPLTWASTGLSGVAAKGIAGNGVAATPPDQITVLVEAAGGF